LCKKNEYIRPSKKKFWFSDNGFKKKGKVGKGEDIDIEDNKIFLI
jgi:hypothetical protein